MSAQYAYAQPSHYGSGGAAAAGIPPAAYATSYVPLAARIMAGHSGARYPSAGAQAPYVAAGGPSSASYPTSIPSYQYSGYPTSGAATGASAPAAASQPIPPTHATPYTGSGAGAPLTIQSFTSTTYSYSAGGGQTTYSVSSVSTSNKQGGLDVYRSTSTKHYGSDGTSTVNYRYDVEQQPSPSSSNGVSPTNVTPISSTSSSTRYDYPARAVSAPQYTSIPPNALPEKRPKSTPNADDWNKKDHRHVWEWQDPERVYPNTRRSKSSHRDRERPRDHYAIPPATRYPAARPAYEVEEMDDDEVDARTSSHRRGGSRRRAQSLGDQESQAGFKVEEIEDERDPFPLQMSYDTYVDPYAQVGGQALVPYGGLSRR